ncbi:MAG: DNA-directed RNA polymerase subunit omega [Bacteroidales bacterium]|nr:DNA-directed RNA polymerase subunit omega [Bacteroidales bacterium]MBQ5539245.1 DNA-directed RNA polymerase subunit omega [Bacteroidales bacterium]
MDYKKINAPTSIITRDTGALEAKTGNLYETVVVASRRADQIGVDLKNELNKKLEEFASYTDNLEEIFENREQIEISKFYEKLPKPTLLALEEIMEDKIQFRIPSEQEIAQAEEIARAKAEAEAETKVIKAEPVKEPVKSFDDIIAESTEFIPNVSDAEDEDSDKKAKAKKDSSKSKKTKE